MKLHGYSMWILSNYFIHTIVILDILKLCIWQNFQGEVHLIGYTPL